MQLPSILQGPSLTRLLQGAFVGAIATAFIGFNWGGWVLGSTANDMATTAARTAVVDTLVPICVKNFREAPDAFSRINAFNEMPARERPAFVEQGGWATFAEEAPAQGIARACAVELAKASS